MTDGRTHRYMRLTKLPQHYRAAFASIVMNGTINTRYLNATCHLTAQPYYLRADDGLVYVCGGRLRFIDGQRSIGEESRIDKAHTHRAIMHRTASVALICNL